LHIAHPEIFAGAFFYRTSTRLKLPSDSLTPKGNQSRPASEASEKTVKERRPFVAKVVRAFTEALHFIKTNKEETKTLIGKNLKTNDAEGLERAYRAYNGAFPEVPYPNAEGVKTLLDDIAPRTPKAATADPKSFVDMSLVQELEASGFTKLLYKK